MQKINHNFNISFGWAGKTHKALTQAAVNKVNKTFRCFGENAVFNTKLLTEASILPDRDLYIAGSHSADIDNPRVGDAFSKFKEIDKKIRHLIKNNDSEFLNENIGRALHYLQDMQNPLHVNYAPKSAKREKLLHSKFEESAVSIQHETIKSVVPQKLDKSLSFENFLEIKMNESKAIANYIIQNLASMTNTVELERQGLKNAYQVTYKYLSELAKLMK